ncbi:MAG: hypothetical protein R3F43_09390 [bacterium]
MWFMGPVANATVSLHFSDAAGTLLARVSTATTTKRANLVAAVGQLDTHLAGRWGRSGVASTRRTFGYACAWRLGLGPTAVAICGPPGRPPLHFFGLDEESHYLLRAEVGGLSWSRGEAAGTFPDGLVLQAPTGLLEPFSREAAQRDGEVVITPLTTLIVAAGEARRSVNRETPLLEAFDGLADRAASQSSPASPPGPPATSRSPSRASSRASGTPSPPRTPVKTAASRPASPSTRALRSPLAASRPATAASLRRSPRRARPLGRRPDLTTVIPTP